MATDFFKLVIGSVSLLVALYADKYERTDREQFLNNPTNLHLPETREYDFIVVGGGSSGSVVANRLSKKFTVLLIEAGGDPLSQNYLPANYGHLFEHPSIMYSWHSVKQAHSNLDKDGIAQISQGRFLGGSSVVNGMSYNRGHPKDYDNWANITGDKSWSYDNILQYFKMTEDFHLEENSDGHLGVNGPLPISRSDLGFTPLYNAVIGAGKELGYTEFKNPNSPQREGFGPLTQTIQFGRRVTVYDAWLKPILDRSSLTILKYSTVSKVDIDENKNAVGVYYKRHGILSYAKARKEVILSAGAMNSPVILLRSGIGPVEQLKSAGIPVKVNLPGVGQNFQDHPNTPICGRFDDVKKYPYLDFNQNDVDEVLQQGKGPLTLPGGINVQGFIVSSIAKSEGHPDWPDIELTLLYNSPIYFEDGDNSVCIFAFLGRVQSRGSISLDLNNISNPGIWDPQWLAEERDVKVLAEGVKLVGKMFESPSFTKLGFREDKETGVHQRCKEMEYGTDEYWKCRVRYVTKTTWHPSSTCKMGPKNDPLSVVDSKLRVKGIGGLRVVDNSIQPTITNANLNAPAIMIGQKGAHMILQDHLPGDKPSRSRQSDEL